MMHSFFQKTTVRYTGYFLLIGFLIFHSFFLTDTAFLWNIDGVGQFYPAFLYIGKWLREALNSLLAGHFNLPFFDLSIGMGEGIIDTLNYYGFGDPLNLLAIFATKTTGIFVWNAVYIFRFWLAGLSFLAYARYQNLHKQLSMVGALCYTFSTFALLGGLMYSQFLSPLVFFPLILLGCEKLWKEQKKLPLICSVAYATLCNFYFLYMIGLFLVFYCLVRLYVLFQGNWKQICLRIAQTLLFFCLGIVVSLPLTFPYLAALFSSNRASVSPLVYLFHLDNWKPSMDYLLYYLNGWKASGFMHATVPEQSVLQHFVHFWVPNHYYWTGIPIFLIASLLFLPFFIPKTNRVKQVIIAIVLGSIVFTLPITYFIASAFSSQYDRWVFLLQFGFVIGFIVFWEECEKRFGKRIVPLIRFVSKGILFNLAVCGMILFYFWNTKHNEFISNQRASLYVDSPVQQSTTIQQDTDLFRISNDSFTTINGRPENTAMLHHYNSLTFWYSVINPTTQEMVNHLANRENDYRSYGFNHDFLYETLAGVKYYLQKDNTVIPAEYELVETLRWNQEQWAVYKNPYALPLVYAIDKAIVGKPLLDLYQHHQTELLRYITPSQKCSTNPNQFQATIALKQDSQVILAIPYSPHWSVSVDHKPATVYQSDIYYIAVDVPAGQHQITFNYSLYSN